MTIDQDYNLAIQHELFRFKVCQRRHDLRKISPEWLTSLRLQLDFVTVPIRQASESIPLRLILPKRASWNFVHEFRLHRRKRRLDGEAEFLKLFLQLFCWKCTFWERNFGASWHGRLDA